MTKNVSVLIPIRCKLALIFANDIKKAETVLQNAAQKKKNNSGITSIRMLCKISKMIKTDCTNNGILRCDTSESITESALPKVRNK